MSRLSSYICVTSISFIMMTTLLINPTEAVKCRTLDSTTAVIVNCSKTEDNCDLSDIDSRVTVLDCSFISLQDISGSKTAPKLMNLVSLNFSHNKIETMDRFIAQENLGHLRELDLNFNRLSDIPPGIQKVDNLKLENNLIKTLIIDKLTAWKGIRFLSLRGNLIESVVCDKDKKPTMNLQRLDLSSNKILKINSCTFSQLRKLKYLDLSNNGISEIEEDSFKWLEGLIHLDLSSNKIHLVPSGLFGPLTNVKYFNLSDNMMTIIPDLLPMTDWFDISFNRISHIPEAQSHVLYPQAVFLIGGNPFDCTCDLLWLKELYDTREYLLKYNNLDTERFIPICQSPEEISGETWDNLGDEVFHCTSLDKEDLKLTNEQIENVLNKEKRITATEIGQHFVDLKWYALGDVTTFELSYRVFGKSAVRNVVLPVTVTSYRLKKLEPNTPYVICLISESDPSKQNCVEIMTEKVIEANGFNMENFVIYIYTHRTIVAVTVGIIFFTYAMLFMKPRNE